MYVPEASTYFGLQTSGMDLCVTRYDRKTSPSRTPGSDFGLAHSPSPTVKRWRSIFSCIEINLTQLSSAFPHRWGASLMPHTLFLRFSFRFSGLSVCIHLLSKWIQSGCSLFSTDQSKESHLSSFCSCNQALPSQATAE
jgi:hypothetical protein